MRWMGETYTQREVRLRNWHLVFAFIPTQMQDGNWVWLEFYKRKLIMYQGIELHYVRRVYDGGNL